MIGTSSLDPVNEWPKGHEVQNLYDNNAIFMSWFFSALVSSDREATSILLPNDISLANLSN